MKKIGQQKYWSVFGVLLFAIAGVFLTKVNAQAISSSSIGNIYMGPGAKMTIHGDHTFKKGNPLSTNLDGRLGVYRAISDPSTLVVRSVNSPLDPGAYVDGRIKYEGSDTDFIFPVGGRDVIGGWYQSPGIKLNKPMGATVAYYRADPVNAMVGTYSNAVNALKDQLPTGQSFEGTIKDQTLVSDDEYWEIEAPVPVRITLFWNGDSRIDNFLKPSDKKEALAIAAFSKSGVWTYFPAKVTATDDTNLTTLSEEGGTIETVRTDIDTSVYSIFTIARIPQDFVDVQITVVAADITIDKDPVTGLPVTVLDPITSRLPGETVNFRTTIKNNGPNVAKRVLVRESADDGLTPVSGGSRISYDPSSTSTGGVYDYAAGIWEIGDMESGDEVYVDAVYVVGEKLAGFKATKRVDKLEMESTDVASTKDVLEASINVQNGIDLEIKLNPKPPEGTYVSEEALVALELVVTNNSNIVLNRAQMTLTVPPALTFHNVTKSEGTSFDKSTNSFVILNLKAKDKVILTYQARVNKGTDGQEIISEVTGITSLPPDVNKKNDKLKATINVDNSKVDDDKMINLEITKTVDDNLPYFGSKVTFDISVTNHGPGVAKKVSLRDPLPQGIEYVSHISNLGDFVFNKEIINDKDKKNNQWYIGSIRRNEKATLKITVKTVEVRKVVNRLYDIAYDKYDKDNNETGNEDMGTIEQDLVEEINIIRVGADPNCKKPNPEDCPFLPPCLDKTLDTDGDGIPDCADPDADGDGILSIYEGLDTKNFENYRDTDGDGVPDYLDPDDDGDGILTINENADPNKDGIPNDAWDSNNNGIPDFLTPNNKHENVSKSGGNEDIKVYNLLTLDGDNNNDVLVLEGIKNFPENVVTIFNRWGVLVYQTSGYGQRDNVFRGIVEGHNLAEASVVSPGTYFYVIKYNTPEGISKKVVGYLYVESGR